MLGFLGDGLMDIGRLPDFTRRLMVAKPWGNVYRFDFIVQGQGKARLPHLGRGPDQQVELAPAHGLPIAFPLQQPQPLRGQEQPGMLGVDPVFILA